MNFEPRITRMGTDEDRGMQGCAWTSQAGAAVSNPFTSKLARDSEIHRSFCYANGPASPRNLWKKNIGLRLVSKRGDVVKKHPQARLRVSFHNRSSIRVANQHGDFYVFLSVYIRAIRG